MDCIRKDLPTCAIFLACVEGDKVSFIVAVSDDLVAKGLKAGDWLKEVAKVAGGTGGGRPQMAQGGAKDPRKLNAALDAARAIAAKVSP